MFSGDPMDRDVEDAKKMCRLSQDIWDAEQGERSREAVPVGAKPGEKKRKPTGISMETSRADRDCKFRIFTW
jgi:hypothetical protein